MHRSDHESSLGRSPTPKNLQPIHLSRSEYICRLLGKMKIAFVAKSSISKELPNAKFLFLSKSREVFL